MMPASLAKRPGGTALLFTQDRGAGLAGNLTGRPGESRAGAFASPFAGNSYSRNERTDRDVSLNLNPSYASLSTEQSRRTNHVSSNRHPEGMPDQQGGVFSAAFPRCLQPGNARSRKNMVSLLALPFC
jgi:hypothetical protein